MSELNDLYQELLLDHNRAPRNFKELPAPTHQAEGCNPLCGDKIEVFLVIEDGEIRDISFLGKGCAISKASASLMTAKLKGQTVQRAELLFNTVHHMLTGEMESAACVGELGKLAALSGVARFPIRVKCATLAWHALKTALEENRQAVNTDHVPCT